MVTATAETSENDARARAEAYEGRRERDPAAFAIIRGNVCVAAKSVRDKTRERLLGNTIKESMSLIWELSTGICKTWLMVMTREYVVSTHDTCASMLREIRPCDVTFARGGLVGLIPAHVSVSSCWSTPYTMEGFEERHEDPDTRHKWDSVDSHNADTAPPVTTPERHLKACTVSVRFRERVVLETLITSAMKPDGREV